MKRTKRSDQTITLEVKRCDVDPSNLDVKQFLKRRDDKEQERVRQLIVDAFVELETNPQRYAKKFYTIVPKKVWEYKTITEIQEVTCRLNFKMADWVEQALEWAQRIVNGETWESICNDKDMSDWHRVILWKNNSPRCIGSCSGRTEKIPASEISLTDFDSNVWAHMAVPLLTFYKE